MTTWAHVCSYIASKKCLPLNPPYAGCQVFLLPLPCLPQRCLVLPPPHLGAGPRWAGKSTCAIVSSLPTGAVLFSPGSCSRDWTVLAVPALLLNYSFALNCRHTLLLPYCSCTNVAIYALCHAHAHEKGHLSLAFFSDIPPYHDSHYSSGGFIVYNGVCCTTTCINTTGCRARLKPAACCPRYPGRHVGELQRKFIGD
jgi:hypothetical protein